MAAGDHLRAAARSARISIEDKRKLITEAIRNKDDTQRALDENNRYISQIENEIRSLEAKRQELADRRRQSDDLQRHLAELGPQITQFQADITDLDQQSRDLQTQAEDADKAEANMQ